MVALVNNIYTTTDPETGRLISHNELMETLKGLIRTDGRPIKVIAQIAHVAESTIDNWLKDRVTCPRMDTTVRVVMALGYRIEIVPDRQRKH